ncbi:MAG: bifunctional DNA-formamidopyrimidine glycosylase/DNA-(apurinic or apyrimidinic site) lyase [Actinobacteria bacterium]|nr:bifunctional DNA-formamidopyrimidine glycosylase/DNA-(apurinic or apyrimidinic site) lyase [Actinomycetota bacterium]
MPELPEVETVRRDLVPFLTGRTVHAVSVSRDRAVRRQPHPDFIAALRGRRLTDVRRHGKFLIVDLDSDDALVVHLRMSGQLRVASPRDDLAKHTHVVIDLDNESQLRFLDPRTFGEMFVDEVDAGRRPLALRGLGPDAVNDKLSASAFHQMILGGRTTSTVKAALLDQTTLAGVGNLYADEALFAAGVHPKRLAASIMGAEAAAILKALRRILLAAIKARGSSFPDEGYVDAYGKPGGFALRHQVYGRAGQACPRCGNAIEKTVVAQRGTHFCRRCQA